ncbi:DUF1467 family protein [Asticcacaulis sp. SL142]|uniref:DUF1467 family protein n=1 Tax=Asticcacaulis sp. SL142 TaxID=2995155 RepID=UPI00226CD2D6|nr:DUF1467 family protein [Asticcacaulis sp. SL142]WAC48998.1 DUF1467 family protein [Asticcacaulis sp. SL142]
MGPLTITAIFIIIWWTAFFVVLPLGNQSHHEAGIETTDGGDPGAPVKPNLKRKLLTTTYIAAGIWALVMVIIQFGLIPLPEFPG